MIDRSRAAPPQPLLEGKIGCDSADNHDEPLSCLRRCCIAIAWFVFSVLLLYGSGAGLLLATVLQQLDRLPTDESLLFLLFPTAYGKIRADADGYVDLIHQNYLLMAIPWWVASMAWEAFMVFVVLPSSQRPLHVYRLNDTISSMSTGILFILVANLAYLQWGQALYKLIHSNLRFTDAFHDPLNPGVWWLSLFASDMFYYLGHRSTHFFSWLWMDHSVHHSSEEYNLSTALRQPANSFLTPDYFIFTLPLAFFFPAELAILQGQVGLLYQFWIHTQLVPPLPKIELVFNTASLHRIHHARNLRALGKNYGSIFIIFDRLGGTFEPELVADAEPLYYGIIPPLNSWNPLWANLSHLHYMISTQWNWHGWKTPFVHWTPPNSRCPRLGSRLNPCSKFDETPLSVTIQAYVIFEFVLVLLGVLAINFVPLPSAWQGSLAVEHMVNTIAFIGMFFSLVCIACVETAQSYQSLRRALVGDAFRHIAFVALAISVSIPFGLDFGMIIVYTAIGIYGVAHMCWLPLLLLGSRLEVRSACNS